MHKPIAKNFLHRNCDLEIRWKSVFSGIVCEINRNIESGVNKENDRDESVESPNINNQVLEALVAFLYMTIHVPKIDFGFLRIEAQYKSKGGHYNIIVLGTYPITPKLTQKPNCNNVPQYPIPNNYIVETKIVEKGIKYEMKYISNSKINYTVAWKEGRCYRQKFILLNKHMG
ncbi:hypothetical protein Glove_279g40 [Diversispora epigaea]|uniref:Uncharacterized protein n=1 Tax=Diversispora epigaea TaxID=1348612 RepID=A0A397I443_9GLOM|nr:hypothetical protein Glove_279g40 [Diversispora epigaea]